jgi:UDP-N-acetylmuramate--alanine ligase
MSIVFVWAWWSGVRALVQLIIALNIPDIVCIDESDSSTLQQFREHNIPTYVGHETYSLQNGDVVIYSAATKDTQQVKDAFNFCKIDPLAPTPFLYAEFLWEISKYLFTIAITGTHGKSTTTWLVATWAIDLIPKTSLAIVGAGVVHWWWENCRYNPNDITLLRSIMQRILSRKFTNETIPLKQHLFIVEADEFNHHFLSLQPDISIITSMDHDHVDIYPTRDKYLTAFEQFCRNTHWPVFTLDSIAKELQNNDNITIIEPTHFKFKTMIGWHNHTNTSLALAALEYVQRKDWIFKTTEILKQSLESFQWLHRRAEFLGMNTHNIPVYSDYGHHPDEIKSTIKAFQESFPWRKIVCLFEAHQARRLLNFWYEFINAFEHITCFIVPVFTARESFEDIEQYCNKAEIHTIINHLKSFHDLWKTFAKQVNGTYIANREELIDTINTITQWSIIGFSAWILDWKLRKQQKTH